MTPLSALDITQAESRLAGFESAQLSLEADAVPVAGGANSSLTPLSLKVSRDEMNLAEFPLTVLSKRADPSVKTLEFSDIVKGKNGEPLNRKWIITGADKFGLPTSSDDEVLLGLLKLTADEGVRSRKIHFTRYELLKILRWTTEGRSYTRLQNALDRLSGVRIKATNAFYDNETKLHSTRNFGIIDAYEINDGRDTHPSFFTWSEVLFKSFQVGFIKKLDLDFYLDLQSAVTKRLYRYLDKHFWYRSRIQINLFVLGHEKIGISRNYIYASSLRQQLEPALEELKEKGTLSDFEFIGKGKSTEVILVAAHAPRRTLVAGTASTGVATQSAGAGHVAGAAQAGQGTQAAWSGRAEPLQGNDSETLIRELVQRGLAERQVRRLVMGQGVETLSRMNEILAYFDGLIASSSRLVNKNPAGFLYRAIEKPFDFTLPVDKKRPNSQQNNLSFGAKNSGDKTQQLGAGQQNSSQGNGAYGAGVGRSAREEAIANKRKTDAFNLEIDYLIARKTALETVQNNAAPSEVAAMQVEVEAALTKLRAHISPQRFIEAVQRGVEQRLLEQSGFPDLDKWSRNKDKK